MQGMYTSTKASCVNCVVEGKSDLIRCVKRNGRDIVTVDGKFAPGWWQTKNHPKQNAHIHGHGLGVEIKAA